MNAQAAPADLAGLAQAVTDFVPLNRHLGVRVTELTSQLAVAELAAGDDLRNHVGTMHAAALFLVAEAAAGAAFVSAFATDLSAIRFVMRQAETSFVRPARGGVRAVAEVPADRDDILAKVAADGKAIVTVTATVTEEDDGGTVAIMRATYHVSPARG